jgi:hypothetical protein
LEGILDDTSRVADFGEIVITQGARYAEANDNVREKIVRYIPEERASSNQSLYYPRFPTTDVQVPAQAPTLLILSTQPPRITYIMKASQFFFQAAKAP